MQQIAIHTLINDPEITQAYPLKGDGEVVKISLYPSPMGYGFRIMANFVRKWIWMLRLLVQCQSP